MLLGVEGAAAAAYFSAFGRQMTNAAFAWGGRNRRPPRDPLNACLSFGYAMLLERCEGALLAAGLDPTLGAFHDLGGNRASLALDLMEEFRPLVDHLVLTLVNRRQLMPEDFEPAPVEGIWLGKVGRGILIKEWRRRLEERCPVAPRDEPGTFAGLIRGQAQAVRRVIEEGAEYGAAVLWRDPRGVEDPGWFSSR